MRVLDVGGVTLFFPASIRYTGYCRGHNHGVLSCTPRPLTQGAALAPPLPPPPPPPPPSGNQRLKSNHTPKPGYAAIPFFPKESPPVQETSPSSETLADTEEHAPATPQVPMENESQFSPSQGTEDHSSGGDEKNCPVQETEPAPQMLNGLQVTEVEDEVTSQLEQAGEDNDEALS